MIGLVLVTYAHWPQKLLDSVDEAGHDVAWYIHHHGSDAAFAARVGTLAERPGTRVHLHRTNRGLARSWNEGLRAAFADGCSHAMLVNDDLHFVEGGFARFVAFAQDNPDLTVAFLQGLETGGHYAGQVQQQGFACCALAPAVIERVGCFDETFTPAYYEDSDYYRRCILSGVHFAVAPGVLAEHERSKTTRDNPEIQSEHEAIMARNRAYYTRKWGPPGSETFERPFDDPAFNCTIDWARRADPYAKSPRPKLGRFLPLLDRGLRAMGARRNRE